MGIISPLVPSRVYQVPSEPPQGFRLYLSTASGEEVFAVNLCRRGWLEDCADVDFPMIFPIRSFQFDFNFSNSVNGSRAVSDFCEFQTLVETLAFPY